METKDVILQLRNRENLSQEELAEKLFVTRQAVSRWENGETLPNTETLKLLSAQTVAPCSLTALDVQCNAGSQQGEQSGKHSCCLWMCIDIALDRKGLLRQT